MSTDTGNEPVLAPGEIRFVHHAYPALDAGTYRVHVSQQVAATQATPTTSGVGAGGPFTTSRTMHVRGPRFGLQATDLHAVYPPPTSSGDYLDVIPHVVLRRRTLPWEVRLDLTPRARSQPPETRPPWMALLVLHPDEAPPVSTGSRSEVLDTLPATHEGPVLTDNETAPGERSDGDPRLTVVDIPGATLRKVLPHPDDLPWTAHVRQVRTDGKELLGLEADGWFSVVLASRLPAPGENTAHLVSLEGWQTVLKGAPSNARTYRMVSLASWRFTSSERGSFEDLMRGLDAPPPSAPSAAPARGRGLLRAGRTVGGDGPAADLVQQAVADGYVPLRYDMRQGEQSVAWYRGPLTPVPVARTVGRGPLPTAEAGLVYHENMAMFDASYAVAWQLGRLLALSDESFATALMGWRQVAQRRIDVHLAREEALARHDAMTAVTRLDELASRVAAWSAAGDDDSWSRARSEPAATGDPEESEVDPREAERRALVGELRAFVLETWDAAAIATAVARYAATDVLLDLADGRRLPVAPDPKARLAGVDDD